MKNKEKYAKEIIDITCEGKIIAVTKDNKVVCCGDIDCEQCLFDIGESCHDIEQWAESEYVEKPTLTANEKLFLDLIKEEYTYIARDEDGLLAIYPRKPEKKSTYWLLTDNPNDTRDLYIRALDVGFDFIKWEDEEPWSIEDLKKFEVKDE